MLASERLLYTYNKSHAIRKPYKASIHSCKGREVPSGICLSVQVVGS
jgi:hypothetical protein